MIRTLCLPASKTFSTIRICQMPGIARQFEPQITRSGGAPSKYRFVVRCSDCASTDAYEASKPASNETVKSYFDERGWLLGRDRSYDLCPACLARPQTVRASSPTQRNSASADLRRRDTADILARHLGKPKALAAEVFRPKEAAPPQPSPSGIPQQPTPTPSLSPEAEQALAGMAADLKGLRAAVELMADQVGKLVALGSQQIKAVVRLTPALLQSVETLSGSLRHVASAVQKVSDPKLPAGDVQSPPETLSGMDETRAGDPEPAAAPVAEVQSSSGQTRGKRKTKERTALSTAASVVVRSIADAKRPDRYYTSIRLPRELWDRAGFGPDDRLLLDWSGKALTIERAAEGGVKPKSIGDTSVVLQSWKLGNLNLDQPKVAGAGGSLRLTAGRRSPEA
jgi:hypothetical protein